MCVRMLQSSVSMVIGVIASAARFGRLQLTSVTSWSLRTWAPNRDQCTSRVVMQTTPVYSSTTYRETCIEQPLRLARRRPCMCNQAFGIVFIPLCTAEVLVKVSFVSLSACSSMCLDCVRVSCCMPVCVGMCTYVHACICAYMDARTCG